MQSKPAITPDIAEYMDQLGRAAVRSAKVMTLATTEEKNAALEAIATAIENGCEEILAENEKDMAAGRKNKLTSASRMRVIIER